MVQMLMKHGIDLSGLLGIHLNLRRLVVFLDIHFLILVHLILDLIISLFDVICVVLLTMKLMRVLVMHAILNLTLHDPWAILMLS